MELPPWLWGGAPERLLRMADLHGRRAASNSNIWQVQTDEQYRRTTPKLVTIEHLAGQCQQPPRFDLLAARAGQATVKTRVDEEITRAQLVEVARRAEVSRALPDRLYLWQLETAVTKHDQIAGKVADIHTGLRNVVMDDYPNEQPLRDAAVHLIHRASAVNHRIQLAAVFLRIAYDERLNAGQVEHIKKLSAAGKTVFASGGRLLDGLVLFDNYIGPLLGAISPEMWGFASYREFGAVLYSFGRRLAGTARGPSELLSLLPSQGATISTWDGIRVAEPTFCQAVAWWAGQLNQLLAVLTDPAVFTDREGVYVPAKHHQALLTVEQLLRRVGSIQRSHHDTHARRVLLFTVLDTLERLTGRPIEVLCSLPTAERTLDGIRAQLPDQAAPLLLHAAERAVAALKQLQAGFFMSPTAGATTVAGLSVEQATARYIKVLRDATHGHGTNRANRIAETNALLAHHDGEIPHDLPLLGYLYLLDLMIRPHNLRKTLYRGGRS